ncbi:MAG: 16S rRNA (guanine(966)-N(2))-methyltransferase RsmD [Pelagibacteraceae bacterium]
MRIISGAKKGKKILLPDPLITRPLKDNVKENIFNILIHSRSLNINFENTKVIDFFAGSGSFGIECISRGSKNVKFIEKDPKTTNTLYRNLSNNFEEKKYEIIKKDFFLIDKEHLIKTYNPNILFFDPPYKIDKLNKIIEFINSLSKFKHLIIILHVEKKININFANFKYCSERVYGLSKIYILKTNS